MNYFLINQCHVSVQSFLSSVTIYHRSTTILLEKYTPYSDHINVEHYYIINEHQALFTLCLLVCFLSHSNVMTS
jgi:hypothetical protein